MEEIADVVLCGIYTVDHANQDRLPRRNADIASGASRVRTRGSRRWCGRWWSRIGLRWRCCGRRGSGWRRAGVPRERQGNNVMRGKSLYLAVHLEAQNSLCSTQVFSLQYAAVLELERIGKSDSSE